MDRSRNQLWRVAPRTLWLAAGLALMVSCAPTGQQRPTVTPATPLATTSPRVATSATPGDQAGQLSAKPAPDTTAVTPSATLSADTATAAVADFYRDKTIRIIVGLSAGGGFDLTSRLLAKHLPRHVPGSPTIIVENKPGAGSALAANAVFNTEPKDGTVIGNVDSSLVLRQLLGQPGVEYDAARFQWLGATMKDATACLARAEAGVNSIQDSINGKEVILGTLGPGNNSHDVPLVLNATLGSKLRLVPGYQGASNLRLAVDAGEIDGFCITFRTGFLVGDRERLEGDQPAARIFVVMGDQVPDDPLTRGLPSVVSLARTEEDKQMLRTVDAAQLINKPYLVAPEVPRDRVEALRRALAATYADPAFLEEARQAKLDVDPSTAEETARVVQQVLTTPPAVVDRLQKLLASG